MYLLPLTLTLTLSTASIASSLPTHRNIGACALKSLSASNFRSFDAAPGSTAASQVSFTLTDPNGSTTTYCARSVYALTTADTKEYYACKAPGLQFMYGGKWLAIKLKVECDATTVTAQGNATLPEFCYIEHDSIFDGTTCLTPPGFLDIAVSLVTQV